MSRRETENRERRTEKIETETRRDRPAERQAFKRGEGVTIKNQDVVRSFWPCAPDRRITGKVVTALKPCPYATPQALYPTS